MGLLKIKGGLNMKLKGKSVIELTNIKTGEKEIYENKNIVTNSIKNIFGINLSALVMLITAKLLVL